MDMAWYGYPFHVVLKWFSAKLHIMNGAMHFDSSFLPIWLKILSGFVKGPILVVILVVTYLVPRVGRAWLPRASTHDVVSLSFQGGKDAPVQCTRIHKQIAIICAIQFEHLQIEYIIEKCWICANYPFSSAYEPSAFVLPLTISMSFFCCSTQGHRQAAGRRGWREGASQTRVFFKVFGLPVEEKPASSWWEYRIDSHARLQKGFILSPFNQPLIFEPDAKFRKYMLRFPTCTAECEHSLEFLLSKLVCTQDIRLFPPQWEVQTFPFCHPDHLQQAQCSRIQWLGKEKRKFQ